MTDLTPEPDNAALTVTDNSDSFLGAAGDFMVDAITGIPAPIRKNALKAFAQLCTAALDVPIAHLEGLASEKRAESKARVMLIGNSAKKLAEQLSVDEMFVEAASHKFAGKVVREQLNVQKVSKIAYEELKCEGDDQVKSEDSVGDISYDWLNAFEKEASSKSSEEMQFLFGKILAGEIRKPASFSLRTIRLLGQLDSEVAKVFAEFCSLTISMESAGVIVDSRVVPIGKDKTEDPLKDYGISYGKLLLLQEYGLIMAELSTTMDYSYAVKNSRGFLFPLTYQGKKWALEPVGGRLLDQGLRLQGPSLSSVGKELLRIIDISPNVKYTSGLQGYFASNGLNMVPVYS